MADLHAVASGEEEKQHEENRMNDILHIVKEDRRQHMKNNLTNRGRQHDSSKKLEIHRRSPPTMCLLISCEVVRNKMGWSPYFCTNSGTNV